MTREERREAGREYLRRRLSSEQSYGANLVLWLDAAVDAICAVIVRYSLTGEQLMSGRIPEKAQREIDVIIADLAAEIAEGVFLLSRDDRDDMLWFTEFMKREFVDGWTFDDRLEQYTEAFGRQVLMAIAALSLLGVASSSWSTSVKGNLRDLYNSPFVVAVSGRNKEYFSPEKLGRGVPHNMEVALEFLGKAEIANAWMEYDYEEAKEKGAVGYNVWRGSSYPCAECDSHVGYHPISDAGGRPTYHAHCYCWVEWVYKGEE